MSTEAPEILLAHYLKTLKLPTFQREYQKLARLCATEGVDHVGYLFRLAEREMIERDRRKVERRIKAAKFPVVKSLDSFDFTAIPKLNKMQVLELARCEWIERRENVIALGPSGTGKTHVALGLGLAACQKGLSVGFTTAAALVSEMMRRVMSGVCFGSRSRWQPTSCSSSTSWALCRCRRPVRSCCSS
jgi:DNA replication protein DnaC